MCLLYTTQYILSIQCLNIFRNIKYNCFVGFIIVVQALKVQFARLLFFLRLQDDEKNEPNEQIKVSLSVLKL